MGGSSQVGELGEGSCVAERLLEVRVMVHVGDILLLRPLSCAVVLSSRVLFVSAPFSQSPQLVCTLVSSACSFGEPAFKASASSGGVWPLTEYRRCVTIVVEVRLQCGVAGAQRQSRAEVCAGASEFCNVLEPANLKQCAGKAPTLWDPGVFRSGTEGWREAYLRGRELSIRYVL